MSDPACTAALEERLRRVEDQLEIQRLIASYGPLVDAGRAAEVGALWTEEGVYDVDEMYLGSRSEIESMVDGEAHQGLIARGCSHFLGPATVTIDGDTAVAVCESVLLVHHKERYLPARIGVHHWELVRTVDGWRTTRRTTRQLDGGDEARKLLASGARGEPRRTADDA